MLADDLYHCQVVDQGTLREDYSKAAARSDTEMPIEWVPHRGTTWYSVISNGDSLNDTEPLIIRPSVRSERPAKWYLEDGSGRAMAFMSNKSKFPRQKVIAIGYLGIKSDRDSSFMKRHFPELIRG